MLPPGAMERCGMRNAACLPMKTSTKHILPAVGFAAVLDAEARARLTQFGTFAERPVGAYLAVQGRPHDAMSLLLSGRVSVSVQANDDPIELGLLKSGDVVGEMSVIDPLVASATARVVDGPARLWMITREAFDQFVIENPQSGYLLMKALGQVLCRRVRMDSELMLRKAGELRTRFLDMDY